MLALASVVACEPDILVLDEPTSGLDYKECMQVANEWSNHCARRAAVLWSVMTWRLCWTLHKNCRYGAWQLDGWRSHTDLLDR